MIETANIIDLHRSLRIHWPEFADAQGYVVFVHPQPHDTLRPSWRSCVHIIVEFLANGETRPPDAVPVLEESIVWDSHGSADIQHAAIYHQRVLHGNDVLSRYTHLCTRARFRCHVRTEGFRIQPDEASTISEGTLIQIHAIPQVLATPMEFADYMWHGQQFMEASAMSLGAQTLPSITWRFHLILKDGYQGSRDYSPHTSELCDIESAADNVYRLWQDLTPGALSYAGSERGDRFLVFHFLAFPFETDLFPSLIWRADHGGTTVTASWLPAVCTVRVICDLLELSAGQCESLTAESDGIQQTATDRFKPRVGRMIWLRPADNHDEEDEIDFMQQPRPTVSPNLVSVRLLGTHSTSVQVNLRNDEPMMQQLREDWPLMSRIADDLHALHPVSSPPSFVTAPPNEVFLLQFHADASDQVHTDDVLILLTVSFSAPHSIVHNKQRIKVIWGPKKTTRDQFLSYVRMQRHCASATVLCTLFHNNSPWAIQDSSLRNLRDGDHLRLQIRSDKEGWCDFEYSEESARRIRIFADSPPAEHSGESEDRESLSPYSVRSRSRERSRTPGDANPGPPSPADFEDDPIEDTDSHSLLQVDSRALRLTDSTPLTVANPHVSDRWCERQPKVGVQPVPRPCSDLQHADLGQSSIGVDFSHVIRQFEWLDTHFVLPCFVMPPSFPFTLPSEAWLQLPWWNYQGNVDEIQIYVDGSSGKQGTGAGVAIFVQSSFQWFFGGAFSSGLPADFDSYRAELAAATFGLKASHDLCKVALTYQTYSPQVIIKFDALTVGNQLLGNWACHQASFEAKVLRSLTNLLDLRFGVQVVGQHVRGHTGEPGNEIADTLASQASQGCSLTDFGPFLDKVWMEDFAQQSTWFWMLFRQDLLWQEQTILFPATPTTSPNDECFPTQIVETSEVGKFTVNLRCASINVLTLRGHPKREGFDSIGFGGPARQEAVLRQLSEQTITLFALQETRLRQASPRHTDDFWLFGSPATPKGQYGIIVGFSRSITFKKPTLPSLPPILAF